MSKMIPPKGLKEIAVKTERGTKLYKTGRDGLFNVDNPKHAKQMKAEGLGVASTSGNFADARGFVCVECGFNSFFRKCSRCGKDNGTIEMDGTNDCGD